MIAKPNLNAPHSDFAALRAQQSYTDLNSLQHIRQLGEGDRDLALRELAKQFESMFLHMMMKAMRGANAAFEDGSGINSPEMKLHRDMLDSQLALTLSQGAAVQGSAPHPAASRGPGFGLADALYRQLARAYRVGAEGGGGEPLPLNLRQAPMPPAPPSRPLSEATPVAVPAADQSPRISRGDKQAIAADPGSFVAQLLPYAKNAARKLRLDAGVLIAQAALETGWGRHVIHDSSGRSSHNLFNIKADSRWQGSAVRVPTVEYSGGIAARQSAAFRQYQSLGESFEDYVSFLSGNARYRRALEVSADSSAFIQALQDAGYATDPRYAEKVQRILGGPHITDTLVTSDQLLETDL